MALVDDADIIARVGGTAAFVRLFDRDRDGTADPAVLAAAKAYADAALRSELADSHPGLSLVDPVDPLLKDIATRLAIGYAGEIGPGVRRPEDAPYAGLKKSALDDLRMISADRGARLATGAALPFATGSGYTSAPTPVWGSVAGGDPYDPDRGTGGSGGYSGF